MNFRISERLSLLGKIAIILNIVLSLVMVGVHVNTWNRMNESEEAIALKMEEEGVIRGTAIYLLEKDGVELVLTGQLFTRSGLAFSIVSVIVSFIYLVNNEFNMGMVAAITGFFSNFVGGLILIIVIFSGKSEQFTRRKQLDPRDDWERYLKEK